MYIRREHILFKLRYVNFSRILYSGEIFMFFYYYFSLVSMLTNVRILFSVVMMRCKLGILLFVGVSVVLDKALVLS